MNFWQRTIKRNVLTLAEIAALQKRSDGGRKLTRVPRQPDGPRTVSEVFPNVPLHQRDAVQDVFG